MKGVRREEETTKMLGSILGKPGIGRMGSQLRPMLLLLAPSVLPLCSEGYNTFRGHAGRNLQAPEGNLFGLMQDDEEAK